MTTIAYARVSSAGQNLGSQIDQLEAHGYDKLYEDKATGTNTDRPGFKAMMDFVREGDTVVITRIDRMGRSLVDLLGIVKELEAKGVALKVLSQSIDTSNGAGRALLGMLGVFAEFETELRKERQMAGIARAKEEGVAFGRRPSITQKTRADIREDREAGLSLRQIAKKYGVSLGSVQKITAA